LEAHFILKKDAKKDVMHIYAILSLFCTLPRGLIKSCQVWLHMTRQCQHKVSLHCT